MMLTIAMKGAMVIIMTSLMMTIMRVMIVILTNLGLILD